MKKYLKDNKIVIGLLLLIILVQIVAITYVTNKREYYHIDELYSHGLMQYKNAFIFDNEDFLDNWHEQQYFEEYLEVDKKEQFDYSRVYQNQIEDVHPPLYYLLLRIACGFNVEQFSIWPGTILNIIFYLISTILLFCIGKEIFKNNYYALILCLVNGFSIASIETVMYVRMYQLLIVNMLAVLYWHLRNRDKQTLTIKQLLPLLILVIVGFLTHYYYLIILAVLAIMFCMKYIKKKQIKNMLWYLVTLISAGVIGIIIFPYAISHIFFGYRGQEVLENLTQHANIWDKVSANIKIIHTELFNGHLNILLIGILIVSFISVGYKAYVWYQERKGNDIVEKQAESSSKLKYILIPLIIYLIIIIIGSPYQDLRYLMPMVPLIFLSTLYLIRKLLQTIISKRITIGIIVIIAVVFCISVIPKLQKNSYTYSGYQAKFERIRENYAQLPWIYVYEQVPMNRNKTMECYGALLEAKKTYIMDLDNVNSENIKKVLANIDTSNGIILLVHMVNRKEAIEEIMNTNLFDKEEYICMFARYVVWLFK